MSYKVMTRCVGPATPGNSTVAKGTSSHEVVGNILRGTS